MFNLKDNKQNVFNLQKTKSIKKNNRYQEKENNSTCKKEGSSTTQDSKHLGLTATTNNSSTLFHHIQNFYVKTVSQKLKPPARTEHSSLTRQQQLEN